MIGLLIGLAIAGYAVGIGVTREAMRPWVDDQFHRSDAPGVLGVISAFWLPFMVLYMPIRIGGAAVLRLRARRERLQIPEAKAREI